MIDNNLEFDFNDIDNNRNNKTDYKKEIGITKATVTAINIKSYDKMADLKIMEIGYKTTKGSFSKGSIFFSNSLQDITKAGNSRFVDSKGNFNIVHVKEKEDLMNTESGRKLLTKSASDRKLNLPDFDFKTPGNQLQEVLDGFRVMLKGEKEWISLVKNLINYDKALMEKKNLIDISEDWSGKPLVPSLKSIYESNVESLTNSFEKFADNTVVICNLIKIMDGGKEYMEALSEVEAGWKFDEEGLSFDEENPFIKGKNAKGEEVIIELNPDSKKDQTTIKKLTEKKAKAIKSFVNLKKFFEGQARYKVENSKEQMVFLPVISMEYFDGCQEMEGAITNIKIALDDDGYAEDTYVQGDEPNF